MVKTKRYYFLWRVKLKSIFLGGGVLIPTYLKFSILLHVWTNLRKREWEVLPVSLLIPSPGKQYFEHSSPHLFILTSILIKLQDSDNKPRNILSNSVKPWSQYSFTWGKIFSLYSVNLYPQKLYINQNLQGSLWKDNLTTKKPKLTPTNGQSIKILSKILEKHTQLTQTWF